MKIVKQLSTAVRRDPAVLEAARGKTESLVAYVKAKHPEQHIQADTMFRCPLDETQLVTVRDAMVRAMNRGCSSPSEVLWMWAIEELSKDESPLQTEPDGKWGHA